MIGKKSRKPCSFCQLKNFEQQAQRELDAKRVARARTYVKYFVAMQETICMATRLSVLHPCSVEHESELRAMRKKHNFEQKQDKKEAQLMLENAERLREKAKLRHAERLLAFGPSDGLTFRAKLEVERYNRLVGQRRRRLNELQ